MGLRDTMNRMAQEQQERQAAGREAAAAVVSACHDAGSHYLTEVNKGSIRMQAWQSHLNDMYRQGYRLSHVFEQDGNTIQVYEHHSH
jgi:hypothetical protein